MKQILYKTVLIFALAIVSVSCEEEYKEIIPELEVSTYSVTLSPEGGSVPFYIKAYAKWNITMADNWCRYEMGHSTRCFNITASDFWSSLSTYSGKASNEIEIMVSALEENPTYFRRWYDFKINAGDLSRTVRVTQLGKPYLEIEQTHYEIGADTSFPDLEMMVKIYDGFFEVTSNAEWLRGNFRHGLASGAGVSPMQYRIQFYPERNTSPNPRAAVLTFTQGNLSRMVTVRQAGAN